MPPSRRAVLHSLVGGSIVMPAILSELLGKAPGADAPGSPERRTPGADAPGSPDPLSPKKPHFEPKAKRVIFLFSTGGVSHLDTFDPKDKIINADGKATGTGGGLSDQKRPLLRSQWAYRPAGACGTRVSDLFPHVRERMDDIALVRSMKTDDNEHYQATLAMHTGSFFFARPSLGSWVSYGLGTVNANLPSFVVISPYSPYAGSLVWNNDFLPAYHQGTRVLPGKEPIANLARTGAPGGGMQELELGLAGALNRRHLAGRPGDGDLAARIRSFETAFRMQSEAPDVFDLSKESNRTLAMYGLKRGQVDGYGWQCLVARRLIEKGVRFVELIDRGASNNWDQHDNIKAHEPLARAIDRPIAGLLSDLKQRGLLDDTLVVWTTEFGRTPGTDGKTGRGGACFSSWLAGGGVKGGIAHGETDDIGARVAKDEVHVHDFHATILHLLGFDHEKLTYRHAGRDYRLTDVYGKVVRALLR